MALSSIFCKILVFSPEQIMVNKHLLFQYHQNQQFDLEVLMNAPSKSSFEWEDIVLGGSEDQRWMTDVARDYVSRVLTF